MRSGIVAAAALVAVNVAACGSGSSSSSRSTARRSGSRPTRVYQVKLSGSAEAPPASPHGSGVAIVAFHGTSKVCWRFAHLHGFTHATFSHIHMGTTGHSGPIVVPLSTRGGLRHEGCVSISPALTKKIWSNPRGYYVNIHSKQYPAGAVRAQL